MMYVKCIGERYVKQKNKANIAINNNGKIK